MRLAVRVLPPDTAEIVEIVCAGTVVVVMVKVALFAPAATLTLDGTFVALESSDSDTTAPPLGAGALNVTVPLAELPPFTLVGSTLTLDKSAAGAAFVMLIAVN